MRTQVYFIGAGPGDPELITVRGRRLIEEADVLIWADSLVNPDVMALAKKGAEIHTSADLSLGEITAIMKEAVRRGKMVARVHSGEPSIYGAIQEQMAVLDEAGIDYEVVPGVSSLFAAAAALKTELTIPELSQTVIITRLSGRTPVPEAEKLKGLASHNCSMAIFLSTGLIKKVVKELVEGGYPEDTPSALVYRASWPEQKIVRGSLKDLAEKVKAAGITRQALILVGRFLEPKGKASQSKLYDKDFKHGYR